MLDMVGEAVDRLITIEAKNHGMPHGILQPMYDAARKAADPVADQRGGVDFKKDMAGVLVGRALVATLERLGVEGLR